ncbi:MAG: protein-disulfide reductase DsbD family protein [Bacteroidia bacterium]|nr:protein-disulfide reductase DsbD family protein [Bacteroidia bacterium]
MNLKSIITCVLLAFAIFQASAQQNVVNWKFSLQDKGNGEIELVADARIQAGWHLYDTNIPKNTAFPTTLSITKIAGVKIIGQFKATQKPHISFDPVFNAEIGTFEKSAKFVQRFKITDKAKFILEGDVRAQACDDETCTPPLPNHFTFKASDLATIKSSKSK